CVCVFLVCFTATASPETYTLSLHDALPISEPAGRQRGPRHREEPHGLRCIRRPRRHRRPAAHHRHGVEAGQAPVRGGERRRRDRDRKSTRLNSSHVKISYAVFCLKKKKTTE